MLFLDSESGKSQVSATYPWDLSEPTSGSAG